MYRYYLNAWFSGFAICSIINGLLSLPLTTEQTNTNINSQSKILLVGHMRSGSSFTGEMFNQHPNSFYMFEPLLALAKSEARNKESLIRAIKGYPLKDQRAIELLKNLFDCQFSKVPRKILESDFMRRSLKTSKFRTCIRKDSSVESWNQCLKDLTHTCKNSAIKAIKTIRLETKLADALLEVIPDLKVIYLVRDPRAVMQSRIRLNMAFPENLKTESSDLCNRISSDLKDIKLSENKNRIHIVQFENMAKNPTSTAKEMFRQMNIDITAEVIRWIEENSVGNGNSGPYSTSRDASKTIYKWVAEIDREAAKTIDKICFGLFDIFGYKEYNKIVRIK